MSDQESFLQWKIDKGLYGWDHEYADLIDEAHDKGVDSGVVEMTRVQYELTAARDEAERLRERAAELEGVVSAAVFICKEESREWDSDNLQTYKNYAEVCGQRISRLSPVNAEAWLLRKQAEAVEQLKDFKYVAFGTNGMAIDILDIINEAQRLRQQADELEKQDA